MAYGLSPRVFNEDGPSQMAMDVRSSRSPRRSWRTLDANSRLAAVERALKPANDLIDAYPMAL